MRRREERRREEIGWEKIMEAEHEENKMLCEELSEWRKEIGGWVKVAEELIRIYNREK